MSARAFPGGFLFWVRMSANVSEFAWSGRKLKAVELVAQDVLTDMEIAAECGVTERTLERWKRVPAFAEKANEVKTAIAAAVRSEGIANKQNRIDAAMARWDDLETIRQERGADEHIATFPGGKTGFVCPELKLVKVVDQTGEGTEISYREFWVSAFDNSLWAAYLNVEKQIAQETGQWEEKQIVKGEMLVRRYIGVDPDDV